MRIFQCAVNSTIVWSFPMTTEAQMTDTITKYPVLEKIIYHAAHCNGTCPALDLEIDSNYGVAPPIRGACKLIPYS
jgi:hypothetical protein